ncbi:MULTISPECIES: hypothetical protein, partial [unclassified Pseudomonas]|uniref:hypothetical protein n=1 Tax=unclassified Pseudomonas TaxID=196821 RepID=UPI001CBBDF83
TVFANVDTEKRHRVHERSSAENEKSPASVNLQGFSVRLTISLNPSCVESQEGFFCVGSTVWENFVKVHSRKTYVFLNISLLQRAMTAFQPLLPWNSGASHVAGWRVGECYRAHQHATAFAINGQVKVAHLRSLGVV